MSIRLKSDEFREKLFNSLPNLYKNIDKDNKDALYRYLCALVDGGFSYIIQENNGLLDLNDPDNTLSEVLPLLYEQYGFEMFNGIPEYYSRKLLPHLCQCYRRKGAEAVVDYLVSFVANTSAYLEKTPTFDEDYTMNLKVIMDDSDRSKIPDYIQMKTIVENFIPFFITIGLIYTYIYVDEFEMNVDDSFNTTDISDTKTEQGILNNKYNAKYAYLPIIFDPENLPNVLLNEGFILNKTEDLMNEVDWYYDEITQVEVDEEAGEVECSEVNHAIIHVVIHMDSILVRLLESHSMSVAELVRNDNASVSIAEYHSHRGITTSVDSQSLNDMADEINPLVLNIEDVLLNQSNLVIPNTDVLRVNGTITEVRFDTEYGYITSS